MQAFGDDVIFFGTELANGVIAHSDDRGETFTRDASRRSPLSPMTRPGHTSGHSAT